MQVLFMKSLFNRFCILIYLYCSVGHLFRVQQSVLRRTAASTDEFQALRYKTLTELIAL